MKHGTRATYISHKCRCDDCRAANTDYAKRYMQKYRHSEFGRAKTNAHARATSRAFTRLRRLHSQEWASLLAEETAKEPLLNMSYQRDVTA